MPVPLTKLELEIVLHRLDIPDVIAEVLTDEMDDGPAKETVAKLYATAAEDLGKVLRKDSAIPDALTDEQKEVLADAVGGSTYAGTYIWSGDPKVTRLAGGIIRAGNSLAEKVSKAVGKEVQFPDY